MTVEHAVKAADFLARQEASELGAGITPDTAGGVRPEVAAGDPVVQDPGEQVQHMIGCTRRD